MANDQVIAQVIAALEEHSQRLRTLERNTRDSWTPQVTPLLLPELRAFWPFSSVDNALAVYDISGQGRTLSDNGTVSRSYTNGYIPYASYDGVDDYHSRADEAGLDFSASLTTGFWAYFETTGTQYGLMNKWLTAGNEKSWHITKTAADLIRMEISLNGTATSAAITTTPDTVAAATWYHIIGRFTGTTSLAIFLNGVKYETTAFIPATLFNNVQPLILGSYDGGSYLSGRMAMPWLSATSLSDDLCKAIYLHTRALFGV